MRETERGREREIGREILEKGEWCSICITYKFSLHLRNKQITELLFIYALFYLNVSKQRNKKKGKEKKRK